jgi:hypothetical protein
MLMAAPVARPHPRQDLVSVRAASATRSSVPVPWQSAGLRGARLVHGRDASTSSGRRSLVCVLIFWMASVQRFMAVPRRAEAVPSLHRPGRLRRWTVTAAEPPTCHRALPIHQQLHTM